MIIGLLELCLFLRGHCILLISFQFLYVLKPEDFKLRQVITILFLCVATLYIVWKMFDSYILKCSMPCVCDSFKWYSLNYFIISSKTFQHFWLACVFSSLLCCIYPLLREHSGSVVECLPRDLGAADSSLAGITVLCPWARHIYPFSTGSTQKDPSRHNWKIVDLDIKNQIKQTNIPFILIP